MESQDWKVIRGLRFLPPSVVLPPRRRLSMVWGRQHLNTQKKGHDSRWPLYCSTLLLPPICICICHLFISLYLHTVLYTRGHGETQAIELRFVHCIYVHPHHLSFSSHKGLMKITFELITRWQAILWSTNLFYLSYDYKTIMDLSCFDLTTNKVICIDVSHQYVDIF